MTTHAMGPRNHTRTIACLIVLAAVAVPATTATPATPATPATTERTPAQPDKRRSRLKCDLRSGICLLTDADADTDGDGFSDADEQALGTDPNDPLSTPTVGRYLDQLSEQVLPSFASGRTTIFVPPTQTPAGASLAGATGQLSIEGKFGFPVRRDALSRLGISAKSVAAAGLDLTNGLTIRAAGDAKGGSGGIRIGGSGVPAMMGGVRWSEIAGGSAGFNPVTVMTGFADNIAGGPNAGKPIVDVRANGTSVQATFADGSKDVSESVKTSEGSAVVHVSTDANGKTVSERSSVTTVTHSASGTTTTTHGNTKTTVNPDGSKTTDSKSSSKTTDDKGNTTSTSNENSRTVTKPDGSSRTVSTSTTNSSTADGGSQSISSTTVTDRDNKGNTTGTVTTTTTTTTTASGSTATETKTTCTGAAANNCPQSGYVNPDADFDVVVLSPAQMERTLRLIGGMRTRGGSTVMDELDLDTVENPRDPGPIALYDPDVMSFVLVSTPNIYTRGPVPDNYGPDGLPKGEDLDPETLDLPGSGPSDRSAADAFARGIGQLPGMPR